MLRNHGFTIRRTGTTEKVYSPNQTYTPKETSTHHPLQATVLQFVPPTCSKVLGSLTSNTIAFKAETNSDTAIPSFQSLSPPPIQINLGLTFSTIFLQTIMGIVESSIPNGLTPLCP
mmetsp:Transcript_26180/g.37372  ORF Transcript_26180/g.37372 Transcript_26180/m.37372 type:complete len:117 (-) Transcript_26180:256-606(-)